MLYLFAFKAEAPLTSTCNICCIIRTTLFGHLNIIALILFKRTEEMQTEPQSHNSPELQFIGLNLRRKLYVLCASHSMLLLNYSIWVNMLTLNSVTPAQALLGCTLH